MVYSFKSKWILHSNLSHFDSPFSPWPRQGGNTMTRCYEVQVANRPTAPCRVLFFIAAVLPRCINTGSDNVPRQCVSLPCLPS